MARKKAQAKSRLVETILIIIVLSLILVASPKLYGWVKGESKDQICKFTVGSKLFTKVGSFSFIREKCPAYNIIIYDDKFVKDGETLTFKTEFIDGNGNEKAKIFSDFDDLDGIKSIDKEKVYEEKLYYLLAEEMLDCWDKFGRGAEIFDSDFWKNSKQCARCSRILFDDSAITKGKGPYYGLYNFMDTYKHKDSELTYNEEMQMNAIYTKDKVHILTTASMGPYEEKGSYYYPENLVFDRNVKVTPSTTTTYEIIYFMWGSINDGYIKKGVELHNMDVPSHVFFVSSEDISTYFCENFMN